MAKTSSIARNKKRMHLVQKYAERRAQLKGILTSPKTTDEEFYKAQRELFLLPRNSSRVRIRNRCSITGRPRAYIGRFGVSRLTFRELASNGQIPGVTKSSW